MQYNLKYIQACFCTNNVFYNTLLGTLNGGLFLPPSHRCHWPHSRSLKKLSLHTEEWCWGGGGVVRLQSWLTCRQFPVCSLENIVLFPHGLRRHVVSVSKLGNRNSRSYLLRSCVGIKFYSFFKNRTCQHSLWSETGVQ